MVQLLYVLYSFPVAQFIIRELRPQNLWLSYSKPSPRDDESSVRLEDSVTHSTVVFYALGVTLPTALPLIKDCWTKTCLKSAEREQRCIFRCLSGKLEDWEKCKFRIFKQLSEDVPGLRGPEGFSPRGWDTYQIDLQCISTLPVQMKPKVFVRKVKAVFKSLIL